MKLQSPKQFKSNLNESGSISVQDGSEVAKVLTEIEKLVNQNVTFNVTINSGSKDSKTITIHGTNESKLNENLSEQILDYKEAYRWVGQAGLFHYFYGDHPDMKNFCLAEDESGKKLKLPKTLPNRVDIMEPSYEDGICMTVDPGYEGEPMNGESVIRIVFDLEKMWNELPHENFQNLLTNGEAEIRYTQNINDWTKYVKHIDVASEFYDDNVEDDFGFYRAIKTWFPKDVNIELFDDVHEILGERISDKMYKA